MARSRVELVIAGVGGNCIDILELVGELGSGYRVAGFLDDDPARAGMSFQGVKVIGRLPDAAGMEGTLFVFGIGSPSNFRRREQIRASMGVPDERFATLVHPSSSVSRSARLAAGTVVFQQAVIASGAEVGRHVLVLPGAIVSHDSRIGDYACLAGGACVSGGVRVGRLSYLGTNCSVKGNLAIGERCMIGMGSVVLEDVPDGLTVAGNPARRLPGAGPV